MYVTVILWVIILFNFTYTIFHDSQILFYNDILKFRQVYSIIFNFLTLNPFRFFCSWFFPNEQAAASFMYHNIFVSASIYLRREAFHTDFSSSFLFVLDERKVFFEGKRSSLFFVFSLTTFILSISCFFIESFLNRFRHWSMCNLSLWIWGE